MTAQTIQPPTQPPPPSQPRRPAATAEGAPPPSPSPPCWGRSSLASFALGGVTLWGDAQRDDQGDSSTATHRYTASSPATHVGSRR